MVEEFHNEYLHVMIDCKTGNHLLDKTIEKTIKGYVHLVAFCYECNKLGILIDKIQKIALDFKKKEVKR